MSHLEIKIPDIEIDAETVALFESLPDSSNWGYEWTDKKKALLLTYWPIKNHAEVARALGVSTNTAIKKFRELTGQ